MKRNIILGLLVCALVIPLTGCPKLPMAIDAAPSPAAARDLTVVFSGCAQRGQQGYLFCKLPEGANPKTVNVRLAIPTATCPDDDKSCVDYQFFKVDGTPGAKGSILRDQKEAIISLDQILGHADNLKPVDNAEFQVAVRVFWVDQDARNAQGQKIGPIVRSSRMDGLVRLFVTKKEAVALNCNDRNVGWTEEIAKDCNVQFSTGMRTAVCGGGC